MQNYTFLFLLLLSCFACEKAFLGEAESNAAENNFELFWQDIDEHYGLFEARGWNWDSIYHVYRPQVNSQTTDEELWQIFKSMIAYLDDSHTFILDPGRAFFASGSEEDEQVSMEFSFSVLFDEYLENVGVIDLTGEDETFCVYGKLKGKDIGYIYLNGIEADEDDFMDGVLQEVGDHQAIILDIRNNTGGDDDIAAEIAARFADGEHFIYTVETRNGPEHDDFTAKKQFYTSVASGAHFDRPVVLLTDKITVSAAEVLTLHLKSFATVTQIGDTTAGDFSDVGMRRFLPNGWQYQYSIMMYLLPDGQSLDGIGHIPDVHIRNTVADIESNTDKVMDTALDYLFDNYGIE